MLYVGDLVKIIKIGNPNFGELGRVKELRSAVDDKWALVQTEHDEDYYRISELVPWGRQPRPRRSCGCTS